MACWVINCWGAGAGAKVAGAGAGATALRRKRRGRGHNWAGLCLQALRLANPTLDMLRARLAPTFFDTLSMTGALPKKELHPVPDQQATALRSGSLNNFRTLQDSQSTWHQHRGLEVHVQR